jgi:ABC-2 type transport system permease protein
MQAPKRNALAKFGYTLGLYGHYLRVYFKTLAEYRADTIIAVIASVLSQGSGLLFLSVIIARVPQLAGWHLDELVFIFGFSATSKALNQTFLNAPFSLTGFIQRGRLDVLMIRPAGVLFQIVGLSQELNGVGQLFTGLAIMAYSALRLDVHWSAFGLLYTAVALVSSALIQFAVLLTVSVLTFWVREIRSLIYPVNWLYDFTRYPIQIFHPVLRGLLTYVIPYAVGSFFPAAFLLHPGQYAWAAWGVPAVAAVSMAAAMWIWSVGLRHYSSVAG